MRLSLCSLLMKSQCYKEYKMKVRLITDGGFGDMERLDWATVFEVVSSNKYGVEIDGDDLETAGGRRFAGHAWPFYTDEYEIMEK